jgi:hypothetical protein
MARHGAPKEAVVKQWFGGISLGLALGIAVTAFAQAPAAPAPAPAATETLDDNDKLLIELVTVRAQLANDQCSQLDSMKQFAATRTEAVKRIEAKHAGYKLDLASGKLVKK